jgi:hypothetical protein
MPAWAMGDAIARADRVAMRRGDMRAVEYMLRCYARGK